ncbi:unnamed protein product [Rotaria sp. Silwood1]|nr:unnamed protein product [Rotaria sp. Silwood1]CAF1357256.1 unnamed protein product [Rotaria sp. Silwood1]CAF3548137.1 unnamed protein product [Rotaria sp. Silwood1]CAF4766801.1 unnamed protein product [Rotaria sp. Silwood1]
MTPSYYTHLTNMNAGIGGSHHAYRLSSAINKKLCLFERNNYVGGRTYDRDYDGNSPEAYANTSISSQGAQRFYLDQAVIKQLADELNIFYYSYDYRRGLNKARRIFYISINQMCSRSYINLTCTDDSNGLNSVDQLWNKLMEEYHRNTSSLYNFADFNAFCRFVHGDEATEFLRDSRLRSIFIDVQIPRPTKVFTQIWSGAWHFQKANSIVSNKQIISWALYPLQRFTKHQFTLVGEAFHLDRAGWTEAAIKSSLISLTSQFDLKFKCYENDVSSGGRFCSLDFV